MESFFFYADFLSSSTATATNCCDILEWQEFIGGELARVNN
jgi:hypothetical protein